MTVVHGGASWDVPTLGVLILLPCLLVPPSSSRPHSTPPSFISLSLLSGQVLGDFLVPDSVRSQGRLLLFLRINRNPSLSPQVLSWFGFCSHGFFSLTVPSHLCLLCSLQTPRASLPSAHTSQFTGLPQLILARSPKAILRHVIS